MFSFLNFTLEKRQKIPFETWKVLEFAQNILLATLGDLNMSNEQSYLFSQIFVNFKNLC